MRRHTVRALVLSTLLAGAVSAVAEDTAPPIPGGAVEHAGHHYLVFDEVEDLSWSGGKTHCESLGGYLTVVTSEAEAAFIAGLCDGRYLFLGASDAEEEGNWVWVDGSPWEYTFWMDGQPNNYGGTEDYLATYSKGRWVDVEASGDDFWMPTGYICEWSR